VKNQELCNLRKIDVDFKDRTLKLRTLDDNGNLEKERTITVRQTTIDYIDKALKETYYKRSRDKKSKDSEDISTYLVEYKLPYNGYVFRQPATKDGERNAHEERDPISWTTINSRIKRLAVAAKKPYLTTQSIWQSGMLYRILEIEEEKGSLTKEDYIKVVTDFGNDPSSYFSLKQLYITRFNPDTTDRIGS
jgi:hypothetical protein